MYIFGQITLCAIDAALAVWFVTYFNGGSMRNNRRALWFMLISFAVDSAAALWGMSDGSYYYDIIPSLVGASAINLLLLSVYSHRQFSELSPLSKALPPFVFHAARITSILIAATAASYLCGTAIFSPISSADKDGLVYIAIKETVMLLLLLLSLRLGRNLKDSKILYFILPLPILQIVIVLLFPLADYYQNFYNDALIIYYIVSIAIATLTAFGLYLLLYQSYNKLKLKQEKELYENMLKMEARRYEEIKSSSRQIGKIRHDIKNMLFSVQAELNDKNPEQALKKLDEILNRVNSVGTIIQSENRTVDCIVNAKLGDLEHRAVTVAGNASGIDKLNDVDIAIILGNILDNAIEATDGIDNAVISLLFSSKGGYQNIICKNTVNKSVLEDNPSLRTDKDDKDSHGFGLKSVKEIVSSYDGLIDFYEEGSMFCVQIMLPVDKS